MEWFESWFDTPYYHILYKNHDYREAEAFLTQLIQHLSLEESSKIIDLACGKGRHSVFLNKMGFDVLGLDLSKQSIAHNKAFENEKLHFRVHDMRTSIKGEPVDAVMNLFTSFGYFDDPKDDLRVFQSVEAILKPGGYFVLDYMNQHFVRKSIVENTTVEREKIVFNIQKKIEEHHIIKDIQFEDQNKDFHFTERVKLHSAEEIERYAETVGFECLKIWGNYQLDDFDLETSPRCIHLFRKKALGTGD